MVWEGTISKFMRELRKYFMSINQGLIKNLIIQFLIIKAFKL